MESLESLEILWYLNTPQGKFNNKESGRLVTARSRRLCGICVPRGQSRRRKISRSPEERARWVAGVAWPRQARCTRRLEPWNPREVRADVPLRPSGHAELEEQVPEPSRPGGLL